MRKNLTNIALILIGILCVLLLIYGNLPQYAWIDTDTISQGISYIDDDREDRILYWGYEKCPWCKETKPVLQKVAKKLGAKVHYIQTEQGLSDAEKEVMKEFLKEYEDIYITDDGVFHFYVPTLMIIKDGKLSSVHMGTVKEHDATERKMTEEEVEEVEKIYTEMISEVY